MANIGNNKNRKECFEYAEEMGEKIAIKLISEERKEPPDSFSDPCPECGTELICCNSGGVKCPSCNYWFCY